MPQLIALLGDSIFDNSSYTGGEPDVVHHLRELLPEGWTASLLAVDGARLADLPFQFKRVEAGTTHIVLSIGGNDALGNIHMLDLPVSSTADTLDLLADTAGKFEASYRDALEGILSLGKDTTLCTVYNGSLPPPLSNRARVAITLFNDVILRLGAEHGLKVIDLRLVCYRPEDYANPIEPSGTGGRRIAEAIAAALAIRGTAAPSHVFGSSDQQ